ncbi:pilus assembly protein TadG-related protein [Roseovarius mucosus]|uniref:pilus assembly protein TadG-related protein n=1 Tax=Roseovarius mucosus TaxID=215743 RepID=UPI0035CFB6BD|tara:strand:+ start:870 stop:2669 length:1800 start_codon:yes stop_codon:yes gene_type:complete
MLWNGKTSGRGARSNLRETTRAAEYAERFAKDEEGTVTVLAFAIFVMFLVMGGIGIDMMRQEMARASLQATLDRAVLAGATAVNNATARAVIEDYFAKSGQSDYLAAQEAGDIDIRLNSSKVTARATQTLDTYLMRLAGVDTLTSAGNSTAEVTIPKLEIAMALDVSGSMIGARIDALKPAAIEFVDSILDSTEPNDAVISVVPFSWGVTPSKEIYEALTVNETHKYSSCLELNDSHFTDTTIDPNTAYNQLIYTSREGVTFGDLTTTPLGDFLDTYNQTCYTQDYFNILPYATTKTALHDKINGLQAGGSTSNDEGVKWAAALLDPAFQPVVTSLQQPIQVPQDDGTILTYSLVEPALSDMPAVFNESETLKVIVLMGDGANDNSYSFSSTYRGANSDLFKLTYEQMQFLYLQRNYDNRRWYGSEYQQYCNYSGFSCIYEPTGEEQVAYFLRRPSDSRMFNVTDGGSVTWSTFNNYNSNTLPGFISSERLSWETAWGLMSPRFYGNTTGNWGPWNNFLSNTINRSKKDERLDDICREAKSEGIVIYTIAFEMGSQPTGADKIKKCASSVNHHYNATTVNIASAFSAIAANVKQLRLTQ